MSRCLNKTSPYSLENIENQKAFYLLRGDKKYCMDINDLMAAIGGELLHPTGGIDFLIGSKVIKILAKTQDIESLHAQSMEQLDHALTYGTDDVVQLMEISQGLNKLLRIHQDFNRMKAHGKDRLIDSLTVIRKLICCLIALDDHIKINDDYLLENAKYMSKVEDLFNLNLLPVINVIEEKLNLESNLTKSSLGLAVAKIKKDWCTATIRGGLSDAYNKMVISNDLDGVLSLIKRSSDSRGIHICDESELLEYKKYFINDPAKVDSLMTKLRKLANISLINGTKMENNEHIRINIKFAD